MRTVRETSKVEMGKESIKSMKSHAQKGITLNAYLGVDGGERVLRNRS